MILPPRDVENQQPIMLAQFCRSFVAFEAFIVTSCLMTPDNDSLRAETGTVCVVPVYLRLIASALAKCYTRCYESPGS